jgi:hypothetical protein
VLRAAPRADFFPDRHRLLDLNLELAELEAEGQAIVGPWDPNRPPKPANQ